VDPFTPLYVVALRIEIPIFLFSKLESKMTTEIQQSLLALLDGSPIVLSYILAICSLVVVGFALYVVLASINKKK